MMSAQEYCMKMECHLRERVYAKYRNDIGISVAGQRCYKCFSKEQMFQIYLRHNALLVQGVWTFLISLICCTVIDSFDGTDEGEQYKQTV